MNKNRPHPAFRLLGFFVPRNPKKNHIYSKGFTKLAMRFLMKEGDVYYTVPKDKVIKLNEPIAQSNSFLPSKLVHHYIDKASHHGIARHCMCRTGMDCKKHPKEYGCILLGKGVADANNLLRRVTKQEAHQYAEQVREAGLVHTIGRTYGDTLAFRFPKNTKKVHQNFMIICNCCSCCCLARMYPFGVQSFRDMVFRMPGVEIAVNDKCVGCGTCIEAGVCMFGAIRIEDGKARRTGDCVACGRCAEVCPQNAVTITIDEGSVSETIHRLSGIVDVT
jgi:ferredoxin